MPTDPDYIHADVPHERTVEKEGTKYGCWNSQRKECYFAPDRSYPGGSCSPYIPTPVKITNTNSKECRYDFRTTDKKCFGCEK